MKNIIVGTIGHVDHGKSALVRGLTGIDPDRWVEEKKRGITIDIGFAHYQWKKINVSIVDLPGHGDFIHNLLAGIFGVDLLVLAVAADEGAMPQTREHLKICDLLGFESIVVAVTRCDLVEKEIVDLVEEEIYDLLSETSMKNIKLVRTSSLTGTGLEDLKDNINNLARGLEFSVKNSFRMHLDRSFTVKGAGTIATGTVIEGGYSIGNPLFLEPGHKEVRVRGLQVQGKNVDKIEFRERAAINIANFTKNEVKRGQQLVTDNSLIKTRLVGVRIKLIPEHLNLLKNRTKVKFYSGTKANIASVILPENFDSSSKEEQFIQIRFDGFFYCRYGDRFILRSLSSERTIAGGKVIFPKLIKARKDKSEITNSLRIMSYGENSERIIEALLKAGVKGEKISKLSLITGVSIKELKTEILSLLSKKQILLFDKAAKKYSHPFHFDTLCKKIEIFISNYHEKFPERRGIKKVEILGKMSSILNQNGVNAILSWGLKEGRIQLLGDVYRLPNFKSNISSDLYSLIDKIKVIFDNSGFQPPVLSNLSKELGIKILDLEKALKVGMLEGWFIKISDSLWYQSGDFNLIKEQLINILVLKEKITVIEFKNRFNISRKHSILLLEYFDRIKLTSRLGNYRSLYKK